MPLPPDDRRCTSNRADGERCTRWTRTGTEHCPEHSREVPPEDRRCTGICTGGTTRPERKGERCEAWAMTGQTVCEAHGGMAKQNRIAGRRRVAEAELMSRAEALVGTPVDNPLTELAALAGRARAWLELMEQRVEKLLAASIDESAGGDENGIRYRAGAGEQLRAEVVLYERAMDRCGKFLSDYGRLGIDERLAKITESQAEKVVSAIDAALAHAGIVGPAATEAKKVAARHLRAVRAA